MIGGSIAQSKSNSIVIILPHIILPTIDRIEGSKKIILTTEKDAMRLMKFKSELEKLPLYVIPISHHFLFEQEMKFIEGVTTFIRDFKPSRTRESRVEVPEA